MRAVKKTWQVTDQMGKAAESLPLLPVAAAAAAVGPLHWWTVPVTVQGCAKHQGCCPAAVHAVLTGLLGRLDLAASPQCAVMLVVLDFD